MPRPCAYLAADDDLSDALTEKDTCVHNRARNNFALKPHQSRPSPKTRNPTADGI